MYEIRQVEPGDWPAIQRFVDATYGASAPYKSAERWQWQMARAPYATDPDSKLPSWIALHAGEVVGQISLQPARLWTGDRSEDAGWIVDVMIDPRHRGAGLGHRIYGAMRDTGRTLVTLTMAEATRRMAERLGCITLPPVDHLVRIERLSARTVAAFVLDRTERRPWLRRPGRLIAASRLCSNLLAALVTVIARLLFIPSRQPQIEPDVFEVECFAPDAIETIAGAMRARLPAMFDRSAAFCNWRFDQAPDLTYRRAQRLCDGKPVGLIIWRLPEPVEPNIGTLVDILADPDDSETIEILASHALAQMDGCCDAVVAGASHPAFIGPLKRLGFFTMRRHRPTIVSSSPETLSRLAAVKDAWHMSKADHDWDQIHPLDH